MGEPLWQRLGDLALAWEHHMARLHHHLRCVHSPYIISDQPQLTSACDDTDHDRAAADQAFRDLSQKIGQLQADLLCLKQHIESAPSCDAILQDLYIAIGLTDESSAPTTDPSQTIPSTCESVALGPSRPSIEPLRSAGDFKTPRSARIKSILADPTASFDNFPHTPTLEQLGLSNHALAMITDKKASASFSSSSLSTSQQSFLHVNDGGESDVFDEASSMFSPLRQLSFGQAFSSSVKLENVTQLPRTSLTLSYHDKQHPSSSFAIVDHSESEYEIRHQPNHGSSVIKGNSRSLEYHHSTESPLSGSTALSPL